MEIVKDFTQLIQEESDEDEDEAKAGDGEEAQEKAEETAAVETPPAAEETKDSKGKKGAAKGGKKGEAVATPVEVEDPNKKPDPNTNKVIPGVVHLKRDTVSTVYAAQQFINYC